MHTHIHYKASLAHSYASRSDMYQKHGAIAICNGKIEGGYNQLKTPISIHAEVHALNNLLKNTKTWKRRITIFVVRAKGDKWLNSKPCLACLEYMNKCGVKKIYYSNTEGNIVCDTVDNLMKDENIHISSGVRWREREN